MTNGDVEIYYETRGPADGIPLLLIQGYTWQMIGWQEAFCQQFVDRGAFVILYDNRDVGLSQKFGVPADLERDFGRLMTLVQTGDAGGGYTMEDMARDGFAVLDDLGLDSAHIAGASMGGMIAQTMALLQPARVRSLNLIYTAPALDQARYFVPPDPPEDPTALFKRHDRETAIEEFVKREQLSGSTAYPYDEVWIRELAVRGHDRCYAPEALVRQLIAMIGWAATPEALTDLDIPTSIIHGRADRRIKVDAALELGRLLKISEMHIYPGLGHEIPEPVWSDFATIIMRTAARAEPV
jgi:pimeloyl-ACP methyl ester carboxylesterase